MPGQLDYRRVTISTQDPIAVILLSSVVPLPMYLIVTGTLMPDITRHIIILLPSIQLEFSAYAMQFQYSQGVFENK